MGLFKNNKNLQFRMHGLMVNLSKVQRNKEDECFFMGLEGGAI